jgi:hypothetical protein
MFKVVLVHEEGVLGIVLRENEFGVYAVWLVDGLRIEYFLEKDEYTPVTDAHDLKEGTDD